MTDQFKDAQDNVAMTVAQSMNTDWLRVVVNYEMLYSESGVEHDRLGFYIFRQANGELAEAQLEFTDAIIEAFRKLNDASLELNKARWTTCDFTLDSDGKFQTNFSYGEPKRINAILDEESYFRFDKYLDFYKASQGIR